MRQEKEKGIQIGKEEEKLFLLAYVIILHVECPKDSSTHTHTQMLDLINSANLQDTKSTQRNQLHSFALTMNNLKRKL